MGLHDALFKRMFEDPARAAGEIAALLPRGILPAVDLGSLVTDYGRVAGHASLGGVAPFAIEAALEIRQPQSELPYEVTVLAGGELAKIGLTGWAAAEMKSGDWDYLADVAQRMDKVLGNV